MLKRNPRLASAEKLVEAGAVAEAADGWRVRSRGTTDYRVSPELRCQCRWEERHEGSRGPRKHILAVFLSRQPAEAALPG